MCSYSLWICALFIFWVLLGIVWKFFGTFGICCFLLDLFCFFALELRIFVFGVVFQFAFRSFGIVGFRV